MADPNAHLDKFVKNCMLAPPAGQNRSDAELQAGRKKWKSGFFEHKVKAGESIDKIANYYHSRGTAPDGCDWKMLSRFNWGVDYPPYINWKLVEQYDFDETQNLTKDKKNYVFKGGEVVLVPMRPGAKKPGNIAPEQSNTIVRRKVEVTGVAGPSLMTPDIKSTFKVTGFSVDNEDVTDSQRAAVKWKIKDLDSGAETESAETGETVQLEFTDADVGKQYQVFPYLENTNLLVCVKLRVIKVELKHELPISRFGAITENSDINTIFNPSAVIIGANSKTKAAIFKLTKVEPAAPDFVLAPNDEGFVWRIKNVVGSAKFPNIDGELQNTGIDCMLTGLKPGWVVLEGWTAEAQAPCVYMTLKVVQERRIAYRVNIFQQASGATSQFSSADIIKMMQMANIHMRQVGIKLVADTNTTVGNYISTITNPSGQVAGVDQFDNVKPIVGTAGHFTIENVKDDYFKLPYLTEPNAIVASCVNAHRGIVVFNFCPSGVDVDTGGFGASGNLPNLFAEPDAPHSPAINGVYGKYKGPRETITPDDTANFVEIAPFKTPEAPYTQSIELFAGGIFMFDLNTTCNLRSQGAVVSHELGHILAAQHRGDGNNAGAVGDDGIAADPPDNLMDPYLDDQRQNDIDLLQLEIFRGTGFTRGGGLDVKAIYSPVRQAGRFVRPTNLSGQHNDTMTCSVEVVRKGKRVKDVQMNFYLTPYDTNDFAIEEIKYWDKTTRVAEKGLVTLRVKFTGNAGAKATIIVIAGDNDALDITEIECTILP
ncbi:hypothetical protein DXX93_14750 [Thalassotalea euphylliae]|uniref:Uncharacterized protein n=1 Tax=Thalassotalea euphylliae TaxID=1655234 RepID=A0A3E0TSR4_9GAMM|nr:hypothetical protein [Thalassotalea euphylliae]REL27691.1 hypothetical protein DXX93_14750 [Thalassotalea euphylliae]